MHAAAGPGHLREQALFGLFFGVSALLQLLWAGAVALRPTRALLVLGVAGHLLAIGLWALTRTVGLPGGLMTSPEAVGSWDLLCVAWESVVVVTGLSLLHRRHRLGPLPLPADWHRGARVASVATLVVLGFLSLALV